MHCVVLADLKPVVLSRDCQYRTSHHGFLVGGAGYGHTTAGALSLLGELHIDLPMILGDQTVVQVLILDLQEDGFAVHVVPRPQEVDHFGGDEDAVAVYGLHSDEAGGRQ